MSKSEMINQTSLKSKSGSKSHSETDYKENYLKLISYFIKGSICIYLDFNCVIVTILEEMKYKVIFVLWFIILCSKGMISVHIKCILSIA